MIRDAHVNGIRLRYREEGGPDDRPLVLLHGRTADHNDWNGITQHFARRGRHVLVPDLRGGTARASIRARTPCTRWPTTSPRCSTT
ncbi:alpha/beta fold hydrolase [Nonomuraea salmonea]|uniref:alpha/beta fold hydrolase n=1 Tax=Nonomuraea salmonea TaxID=46181 RepID=UPI002FE90205